MSDKLIRGVPPEVYAKLRHQVESGQITEEELIKRGMLKPGKGMAVNLDEKIFRRGDQTRGKEGRPNECRVPDCNLVQSRRGLCNTHRIYASRLIKQGKANEQNLVNRGLLLAKNNPTTPSAARPATRTTKRTKNLPTRRRVTRCSYPSCKETVKKRGLCKKHHSQYNRKRNKLPTPQREKLDKDLIRRGLLLPEPKIVAEDPFQLGSKVKGNLKK